MLADRKALDDYVIEFERLGRRAAVILRHPVRECSRLRLTRLERGK
jgi:hypothetical protein